MEIISILDIFPNYAKKIIHHHGKSKCYLLEEIMLFPLNFNKELMTDTLYSRTFKEQKLG